MNIYKIWQEENNGYDTYDSAIVAAESEEEAKKIHPSKYNRDGEWDDYCWASSPEKVFIQLIGIANVGQQTGVILSSFNAG